VDKGVVDILGATAAACSMVSFTPQLVKIWRDKDARSVSLRMYAVSIVGFSLWISYGLLIGRWPVVGCNAVCLGMCIVILLLKWRYGTTAGRAAESATSS